MHGILASASAILRQIDTDGIAAETIVFAAWRRCVDGALAEHIVPMKLERDRLIAAVSSETWRRNVADLGPELAARINTLLGSQAVGFIEFRIDAAVVRDHRKNVKKMNRGGRAGRSAASEIAPSLQASAEAISDEGLRTQFLAAATENLARSREIDTAGE